MNFISLYSVEIKILELKGSSTKTVIWTFGCLLSLSKRRDFSVACGEILINLNY